jgi:hypothetical protein
LAFSWTDKPWFLIEEKLPAMLIIPSSWGSQLDSEITSTPCRTKALERLRDAERRRGAEAIGGSRSRLVKDEAMTLAAKSYWTRTKVEAAKPAAVEAM